MLQIVKGGSTHSIVVRLAWRASIYSIWEARNERLVKGNIITEDQAVILVNCGVHSFISSSPM